MPSRAVWMLLLMALLCLFIFHCQEELDIKLGPKQCWIKTILSPSSEINARNGLLIYMSVDNKFLRQHWSRRLFHWVNDEQCTFLSCETVISIEEGLLLDKSVPDSDLIVKIPLKAANSDELGKAIFKFSVLKWNLDCTFIWKLWHKFALSFSGRTGIVALFNRATSITGID